MSELAAAKLAEEIAVKRCLLVGRVWRDYYDFTNSVHEARTVERLHELERILDSRDANTLSQPAAQAVPDEWRNALQGLVDDIENLVNESDGVTGFHRNGDVARWGELLPGGRFERLTYLAVAWELLTAAPTPPAGEVEA